MKLIDEMLEMEHVPTILKLNRIFSLGYMPSRGNEGYKVIHGNTNEEVTFLVNCMAHSFFNLTNKQLEGFDKFDGKNFRQFYWPDDTQREIYSRVLKFVRKTGLKIERTSLSQPLKQGQWKVAAYFPHVEGEGEPMPDFHFILQEGDGRWSSKDGSFPYITYYDKPPKEFVSNYGTHKSYKLHEYLLVTNPYSVKEPTEDVEEKSVE